MATLNAPTLVGLISTVRSFLNEPDPNNSFWTDAELTSYINNGIRRFFQEMVLIDEGHFTTMVSLDLVAGTESVALPSDCMRVKNVWKKVTNGFMPLLYKNLIDEGYATIDVTNPNAYQPSYSFRGNNLIFHPTPNFSETGGLQLEYIQFPTSLLYGGDTMTSHIAPVFNEVVEKYAVYQAKLKESIRNNTSVPSVITSALSDVVSQFKTVVQFRSASRPFTEPFDPENG